MSKSISELIQEHYFSSEKSFDFRLDTLTEMVEQALGPVGTLNERKSGTGKRVYNVVLGQFNAPTEQAGEPGTDERQRFQRYITRNIQGATLADKIASINAVAKGDIDEGASISKILASLGALKMLQQTLDDFNESTAGFLFEAFLSALLKGQQVTDKVGGTLPIEDCMFFVDPKTGEGGQPVSLKLLATTTVIEGSLVNLLTFFGRPEIAAVALEKGIEYIVAVKTKGNRLDVFSFNINPENFFDWVDEKYFDFTKLPAALQSSEQPLSEELNTDEVIKQRAKVWANNVRQYRYPMMGLSPEQEINMGWKKITDWKRAIKEPSTAAKSAVQAAEIMLSDAGRKSFAAFSKKKFAVPDVQSLEISEELAAQYLQDENPEAKMIAAKQLAALGKERRKAYLNAIEKWGYDQPESPTHIQRYYAMLSPKTGQMKAVDAQQSLRQLIQQGPEGIMKWSDALLEIRKPDHTQFHIRPVTVRGRSTIYGTVNIDQRALYRSISKYSDRLEEMCLPIYDALQSLTDNINAFYFENRPGAAFEAADNATTLKERANALAAQEKENK